MQFKADFAVKAELNYAKHKVTFEEAKSVFYDENAVLIAAR